jgi:hypothetical protein
LPGSDQRIQGLERLVERRVIIPLVQLIKIDMVGTPPTQAVLALRDQVLPRGPHIVGDRCPWLWISQIEA